MVYELNESRFEHSLSLPGQIVVEQTDDLLFDTLGHDLVESSLRAIRDRGVFHLALSGGSTPEPFYMRLCTDPRFRVIPWSQTHIWMVDERRVPADDDRLNFKMIKPVLIDHIPIRSRQVHPMPVLEPLAEDVYEAELRSVVPDGRLDFILLGMGDDGHTASLFPGSRSLSETDRWIAANDGPGVTPPARLTMTYPLINAGREVAVLATKAKKAQRLRSIHDMLASTGPDLQKYPITGVNPIEGSLTWYLDAPAAGAEAK